MPYYLSPVGNHSQISATGAPLSGGKIETYQAGTTTPVATYTDNTGSAPQTQPIVLNTYGLPPSPIWLAGGQAVKFVIKDAAGNLIRTIDNIAGIDDPAFVGADGTAQYLASVAGTNTITASLTGVAAYKAGQVFSFLAPNANTGATTLNINSLGAKAITRQGSGALQGGEIIAGQVVVVEYDGTQFQLVKDNRLTLGTVQATASGAAIDYLSIPSWAKRITMSFAGVSTNGTSNPLLQLGTAGGIVSSGYSGAGSIVQNGGASVVTAFTAGFGFPSANAANTISGSVVFTLLDPATNTWSASGNLWPSGANAGNVAGHVALGAPLTRIRLTTVNGTDAFDAGSVNILFE